MHSPKLLDVIRNFPSGGETLVIRILVTLCDTGMYMTGWYIRQRHLCQYSATIS